MAWLLIDNSNSRTKFRLGDDAGLLDWRETLPTAEISRERLKGLILGQEVSGVVLASVVPEKAGVIVDFFKDFAEVHELSFRSPLGYGFDFENAQQVGNDRLANVLALKAMYGGPGIAVDCGTAVTFSVLSAKGDFSGGVIAPGMAAMTEYLASRTAQLPTVDPVLPSSMIGKTTVEAIQVGAVIGQRGMIREILRELVSELGGNPKIVATGGGADFVGKHLAEIDVIDPDLTLQGLRLLAMRVFV